jgi:hypothetical protein
VAPQWTLHLGHLLSGASAVRAALVLPGTSGAHELGLGATALALMLVLVSRALAALNTLVGGRGP